MKPVLQLALDFLNLSRALKVASEAVKGGVDWIEAGTPLIKSEGLNAVRALKEKHPDKVIVADMKTMDVGRIEVEAAAKAGADVVCVLAAAADSTIRECVEAGGNYGAKIAVDLIGIANAAGRAKEIERMGADYIGVHCSIDEQMEAKDPFGRIKEVRMATTLPIAVAGGLNSETVSEAVTSGANIAIVGGAIIKADDPEKAASRIKSAIEKNIKIKTGLFKRVKESGVINIFKRVSTANLSDAMHRCGDLKNVMPLFTPIKFAGKILTVRTYPGDWAKPVEAVDRASPGDVLVIDAGGVGPAVWGELATHGAMQKKIAGVIIHGAVRDAFEIRKLKFPLFATLTTPTAGEPKGLGEIGVPLTVAGTRIYPGDWAVADDDGVVIVPGKKSVETANRAMSVFELENRLRKEIAQGSTLGRVIELLRWEKKL